ncbi:DUF3104 domain-containing protein [Synechococcus sp. NOUM97013]|uniref:DUF3104 domain-containing protein n=1 Tax=Synechococcus sp. NOUM97013 TaxID=1442555 RepID=UPI001647910A|nr:DUF3104 domain-containing protein [Synechococcus sp. NOUM97013]
MSVDHFTGVAAPDSDSPDPVFLSVRSGQLVIVQHNHLTGESPDNDWWMGMVVFCEGGARKPDVNSVFQIADVDDGTIRWVNADLVSHILHGLDGLMD